MLLSFYIHEKYKSHDKKRDCNKENIKKQFWHIRENTKRSAPIMNIGNVEKFGNDRYALIEIELMFNKLFCELIKKN